jgi:hypothetical protein
LYFPDPNQQFHSLLEIGNYRYLTGYGLGTGGNDVATIIKYQRGTLSSLSYVEKNNTDLEPTTDVQFDFVIFDEEYSAVTITNVTDTIIANDLVFALDTEVITDIKTYSDITQTVAIGLTSAEFEIEMA